MIVVLYKKNYVYLNNIELPFKLRIKKELSIINKVVKNNLSILYSRSIISEVSYIKNKSFISINNKTFKYNTNFKKRKAKYLVGIHCHISLYYERYVLRRIYRLYNDVQLLFFMALDFNQTLNSMLFREMKIYRDIVLFRFYSNYYTLHYLTYNFLKWVKKYQNQYEIIIKQDSDTFVNMKILDRVINNVKTNKSFVLGYIWGIENIYSRYPSGMAYTFLSKSIDEITVNLDEEFDRVYYGYPEDMLFGRLARRANFEFIDVNSTYNYTVYISIPNKTLDVKNIFMIHWLKISEIAYLHLRCNNKYYF